MAIDENELAKELIKAVDDGDKISAAVATENQRMRLRPVPNASPLTPTGVAKAVAAATDPDTDRSTRNMREQFEKIIAGLETEIKEAEEVKAVIERRIVDLSHSLKISTTAYEGLGKNLVQK